MKRRMPALVHGISPVLVLILGFALLPPRAAHAQGKALGTGLDPKVQAEVEYASRLLDLGLPEFSGMVIKKLNDPSAVAILKVLRMKGLLMQGKFDEAKTLISAEAGDTADAMRLALADGYFMWGKYPQAQEIYLAFFNKYPSGPNDVMNKFYMEAAYKYGQMLLYMKKDREAVNAYKLVLKAKLQKHEQRQMMGEMAEIMLKVAEEDPSSRDSILPQVEKIAGDLLWVQDLWWGKAVVFLAHAKMMKGDAAGAMKLIDDYRGQLVEMDNLLKAESEKEGVDFTKLSPLPQVRFMVAAMQFKEAEKLVKEPTPDREKIGTLLVGPRTASGARDSEKGALFGFYDIFVNYPKTPWAPQAGRNAKVVKKMLEDLGAKPNITISEEKWNELAKVQFLEARALFSQGQYATALESYYSIINIFPESEMSVDALGEMVRCYVEIGNEETPIFAPMLAGYLAERFCSNTNLATRAGDQLMRVAEMFGEKGNQAAKDALYKQFFTLYPGHSQTPGVLFRFGEADLKKENWAGALDYFKTVAEKYGRISLSVDAQNRIAFCYGKLEDVTNEVASLKALMVALEQHNKANHIMMLDARNRMAYATWKQGGVENQAAALKQFQEIIALLSAEDNPYNRNEDDKQRSQEVLESALFFKATGFGAMKEPADRVKDFKAASMQGFADLVKRFPKSKFAPRALSQIAALLFADGESAKATDAVKKLEKDYPDSPEAKNSSYVMAMALIEMGYREQGIKYLKEMFASKEGKFSDGQFYSAAAELLKAKEYEIALGGFERVVANSATNVSLHQPALLGKGKCLVELGRYQDAVGTLSTFTNMYGRTLNLIDAALYLGRAYSQLATAEPDRQKRVEIFNMGVRSLKDARKYEKTDGGQARLAYEVGRMQEMKATGEEKFGTKERALEYFNDAMATYMSISLTMNGAIPAVAEWIQKSEVQAVPLMMKMNRAREAYDMCESHVKRFPNSAQLQQIRRWRNQLRSELVSKGESIAPPADGDTSVDTNTVVTAADTNAVAGAAVTPVVAPASADTNAAGTAK